MEAPTQVKNDPVTIQTPWYESIFTPGKKVSVSVWRIMVTLQIAVALLLWFSSGSVLLPNPLEIAHAWVDLVTRQGLLKEFGTSLKLSLQATLVTLLVSLPISYATAIPFFRPLGYLVSKLRFLTLVGLSFVFQLMVSTGFKLKLTMLTFGMSVFFVTALVGVIQSIDRTEYNHARTIFGNEWRVIWEVVVLGRLHDVMEITRQNFAIAWMMLTLVENVVKSDGGLGVLLYNQNRYMHLDAVFAIQFTILLTGIALDYLIGLLKKLLFPYANLRHNKD